jgi:hypothetical protein
VVKQGEQELLELRSDDGNCELVTTPDHMLYASLRRRDGKSTRFAKMSSAALAQRLADGDVDAVQLRCAARGATARPRFDAAAPLSARDLCSPLATAFRLSSSSSSLASALRLFGAWLVRCCATTSVGVLPRSLSSLLDQLNIDYNVVDRCVSRSHTLSSCLIDISINIVV